MKMKVRVLKREVTSVGLILISFLLFLLVGRAETGVNIVTGIVLCVGLAAYSLFRKDLPSNVTRPLCLTERKVKRDVLRLNNEKLSFFAKITFLLSMLVILGQQGVMLFPVNFFSVAVGCVYVLLFREDVSKLIGFDKLKMMMLSFQGLAFIMINRIERGKMAFSCGFIGLIVYCYAMQASSSTLLEVVFSGIVVAGITAYLYNTVTGEYDYSDCREYINRNLNYQGRTCTYVNGKKYTYSPKENYNDIERFRTKRF